MDGLLKPVIKQEPFVLNFLKHDHWLDVTHEHTQTAKLVYPLNTESGFAYICVKNYEQWLPIYWGKADSKGNIVFENMGTEILYRIAILQKAGFEMVTPVFLLDSLGNTHFFKPDFVHTRTLKVSKLNTGSRSWIEKDKIYRFYYADEKSDWILLDTKKCEQDSLLIFEKVPAKTLYKLQDIQEDRRLERIFTCKNDEQIFY